MNGLGDGTFRPNAVTSRAMLVTMLWRMAGEPRVRYDAGFTDVAENAWYAGAVRWAASSGIVSGYDAVTFGPDDGVTREQLALILWRYAGVPADAGPYPPGRRTPCAGPFRPGSSAAAETVCSVRETGLPARKSPPCSHGSGDKLHTIRSSNSIHIHEVLL